MSGWWVLLVVLVVGLVWWPLFRLIVSIAEEGCLAVVLYIVTVAGVAAVPLFFGWDVGRWMPSTPSWAVIVVRSVSIVVAAWVGYVASPMKIVVRRWSAQRWLSAHVQAVIRGRLVEVYGDSGSTASSLFARLGGSARVEIVLMPSRLAVVSRGWRRHDTRVVPLGQVRAVVLQSERIALHRILHDSVGGPDAGLGREVSLLTDRFVLAFMDGSSAVVAGRPSAEIDRLITAVIGRAY